MSFEEVLDAYDKVRKALDDLYWAIDHVRRKLEPDSLPRKEIGENAAARSLEKSREEEPGEVVDVKVKVAKPIVDYVNALCEFSHVDPDEFWTEEILGIVASLVDAGGAVYTEKPRIMEKYGLKEILDC